MILKQVFAPTADPVTVPEAKAHMRITHNDDDGDLGFLINAATIEAELECKRSLMSQTWELIYDSFPSEILLIRPPVTSVTSVKYYDTAGVEQTLSTSIYQTDLDSSPARVIPAYGQSWPTTRDIMNAVTVRYVAGYASASDVPEPIKQWIKIRVATLYEMREATVAGITVSAVPSRFIDGLLDPYRIVMFP